MRKLMITEEISRENQYKISRIYEMFGTLRMIISSGENRSANSCFFQDSQAASAALTNARTSASSERTMVAESAE